MSTEQNKAIIHRFLQEVQNKHNLSVDVIDIFRIDNGKMVEHWVVSDWMSLMQQIGLD